jgi:hypothetical protein
MKKKKNPLLSHVPTPDDGALSSPEAGLNGFSSKFHGINYADMTSY